MGQRREAPRPNYAHLTAAGKPWPDERLRVMDVVLG